MALQTISWDALPKVQQCHVTWLDERELCPMVHDHAHGGPLPDDDRVFGCAAYAAGNCRRAGAFVLCAFHDLAFDWSKARDWKRQDDGALMYSPVRGRRNGRST